MPQLRVEVRERLVHQVRDRLADDRATHRDPLALPAGKLSRTTVEQVREPEQARDVLYATADLRLRRLAHLEAVREVALHVHVRVQGVVLENHRDVPLARRQVRNVAVADEDAAGGDLLEPRQHPHERRLAAPRGTDKNHELAALDRQADVVHGGHVARKGLADAFEDDLAHAAAGYRLAFSPP